MLHVLSIRNPAQLNTQMAKLIPHVQPKVLPILDNIFSSSSYYFVGDKVKSTTFTY